jgi:hypothetical protein|tara:strand:- start:104 stop:292 length:189 start_codon:yes stop_codon:yes gene_type:complete
MNRRISKKLKSIVDPQDPVSKRVYKRLKKQYKRLSKDARPLFLEQADYILNGQDGEEGLDKQ